jgi:hypothetical protein
MLPALFHAIGTDRYLSSDELRAAVGEHPHTSEAWSLYRTRFDGFCETRLDPQWHRLAHPARTTGRLESMGGEPVVVFGTGPSAFSALKTLARMRDRIRLFTSPRGAEVLTAHGLVPDLVLVENRTAIDAHHSARHLRDAGVDPLRLAHLVLAEWRTPRALIAGVSSDRLFVPDPLPTWGPWPATAVALAADAGAARIGLLGIDLGTAQQPDPAFAPLARLLGLLARLVSSDAIDCGAAGARKRGWNVESLEALASGNALSPLRVHRTPASSIDERISHVRQTAVRVAPIVDRARQLLALGLRGRGGERVIGLEDAARELLSWSADTGTRIDLQEGLGLSFLPRLWRADVDLTLGPALWRPIVLATHEMVGQAERLDAVTRRLAA